MKKSLILPMLLMSAVSCSWLENDGGKGNGELSGSEVYHDMIVLGERLDDPYSVKNVEAALAETYPTKAGRIVVKATDLYVRFLPSSQEEYRRLEAAGLNLTDHPLDYKIVREGDYYHDPSLDEDEITWQYAVVRPDFRFPAGIRYEILDECYIAENDAMTRADDEIDWSLVEREAFRLTGNSDMLAPELKSESLAPAPSGRISIVDGRHGDGTPEGVAGVKVSCNTFVKFAQAYTDADGNYKMDKTFQTDIRYRIVFQNKKGFAIGLNKILVPASSSTLGKNGPEGVSITVDKDSDRSLFCRSVVNNSAYQYYEKCAENGREISAPPANTRIWIIQPLEESSCLMLQQGAMIDDTFIGNFLGDYSKLVKMFLPDVIVGVKGLGDYSSIYAQTVHELAHASHFSQVGNEYWNKYVDYIVKSFVETGGMMYGTGAGENAGYCEIGEMWAFYLQNRLYKDRYGEDKTTFGTSFWFHPHVFLYMDERGLGRSEIFKTLEKDVSERYTLQSRLETLYPDYDSVIRQAFDRY